MTTDGKFPLVDIFAGPGGLGEGFSSLTGKNGAPVFQSVASIERDPHAHQTLLLRHFFRLFRPDEVPEDYYDYVAGELTFEELRFRHPGKFREADYSALKISLGPDVHDRVREAINVRLQDRKRWALVGGPPCQAYSLVGRSRMMGEPEFEQDERHFLYREYLNIIIDHRPPVFVMENVKGLLSARIDGHSAIRKILSDLSNPKTTLDRGDNGLAYNLHSLVDGGDLIGDADPKSFLVRAENYGVPQARHRMFIVGIRSDLSVCPGQLQPHIAPTVRETIGGLPKIRSGLSRGADSAALWRDQLTAIEGLDLGTRLNGTPQATKLAAEIAAQLGRVQASPIRRSSSRYGQHTVSNHSVLNGLYDSRLQALTGHEARGHMPTDLHRYFFASVFSKVINASPRLADFPSSLLPNHRNVELGCTGKMFSDRFRVQLPDKISTTITSHISKDGHYFIHYDPLQCRSLTVREAARLQTFPDNYKFEGPRTAQYHQVGNAVPVYLARQIAEIIAEVLEALPRDD